MSTSPQNVYYRASGNTVDRCSTCKYLSGSSNKSTSPQCRLIGSVKLGDICSRYSKGVTPKKLKTWNPK
ncbi:MAG: hypothetical protein ISR90_07045 [Candidatus Marinimicrobia bacterium]|nr:hypothetical protein [Candidatus Neomarinimicrobiota bacterium]